MAPRSDASGAVAPRTSPRRRRSPPRKAEPAALPESDMNGAPAAEASPGKDAPAPAPTLEDVQLAWQAGALDEVVALARASGDPAALRLADRARRFARAVVRARHAPGLAAVPALEEALGIAEEIGRRAPAVDEVRERLAGLHRAAAERAFRSGDRKGALRHVEEALATRPGDREASKLRQTLAAEAATVHREAYALQHLDRARAAALAEEAALLALPGDPVGERARALAARLRGEAPEADVDSAGW